MAPISEASLDEIRARIQSLTTPSISVRAVNVDDVDGTDGPAVLVTVRLTPPISGSEWEPDDFLAIRRQARTIAVDAFAGQDVRLVYESDASAEVEDDEALVAGDKQASEYES